MSAIVLSDSTLQHPVVQASGQVSGCADLRIALSPFSHLDTRFYVASGGSLVRKGDGGTPSALELLETVGIPVHCRPPFRLLLINAADSVGTNKGPYPDLLRHRKDLAAHGVEETRWTFRDMHLCGVKFKGAGSFWGLTAFVNCCAIFASL